MIIIIRKNNLTFTHLLTTGADRNVVPDKIHRATIKNNPHFIRIPPMDFFGGVSAIKINDAVNVKTLSNAKTVLARLVATYLSFFPTNEEKPTIEAMDSNF